MRGQLLFLNAESRILEQIRTGDEEGLAALYRSNQRAISSFVTRNHGTSDDADDILQEALVILWERVRTDRYEHRARLGTFVFATARNLWLRRLARQRRETREPELLEEYSDGDPSPLDLLVESEESSGIRKALDRLGEPCRALLVLFYWEELPLDEIAGRLGFANADTVKSKKYQCKKTLQQILKNLIPDYG